MGSGSTQTVVEIKIHMALHCKPGGTAWKTCANNIGGCTYCRIEFILSIKRIVSRGLGHHEIIEMVFFEILPTLPCLNNIFFNWPQ
jgi:hypothetical protein